MLSGPMFVPPDDGIWKSGFDKEGMHDNVYSCRDSDGMQALREMFPDGKANAFGPIRGLLRNFRR